MIKEFEVSNTTLEAEWVEQIPKWRHAHKCSNCGNNKSLGYQQQSLDLGVYCDRCGARMKNPKHIIVEYDYD